MRTRWRQIITAVLSFFLIACASATQESSPRPSESSAPESTPTAEAPAAVPAVTEEPKPSEEPLPDVDIEVPARLIELTGGTAEQFAQQLEKDGTHFEHVDLKADGSASFTLTQESYEQLLERYRTVIDAGLQGLIDDQGSMINIIDIKADKDYSDFTVTLDNGEFTIMDGFSVIYYYMYGGIYNAFLGNPEKKIAVTFVDKDGNTIETIDGQTYYEEYFS
ncbi:MAG: hypothetical protein IJ201_01560 [Solobacterium sp.]|nr:hypothetical protein [Solobacterium sp.]